MTIKQPRLAFTLLVLLGINTMNFFDRQVLGAVAEPLKKDWKLSDKELGALGTAFILLYAVVGLPLGRWADLGRRSRILAGGAALWSLFTAASGLAWNFWSLFAMRLGVGIGEASCAPAANSLLGDMFPPQRRARALSIFMLGLPLGLGLSFIVSGSIAEHWGWRRALLIAGVPGLLLGLLALAIPEPVRGACEDHAIGAQHRSGAPFIRLLSIPTLWWIILSGALHNFNMYALGQFLSPFLIRYHGIGLQGASWILGLLYGFGMLGILLGGWLCDRVVRVRISGRLEVATLAFLIFVPCMFLALQCPRGDYWGFTLWFLPACMLSYVYYSGVYAAVQDIIEPGLRGTAMALYFCAMYLLGASLGPIATGWASDHFARQAALERQTATPAVTASADTQGQPPPASMPAAVGELDAEAKAVGLYRAMYLIPWLGCGLVLVLFAASRTVKGDHDKLQKWMAVTHSTCTSMAEKCS
ncbi:MAG TPA: MFS transporter [Gemmataceae bacterium]|jgi:MFS family permease|nr:MFS transporter [Gemmataceae bacterium]